MGDVEDPQLYAALPLCEWEKTEHGQWCRANSRDLYWQTSVDHVTYGYKVAVIAEMTPENITYHELKFRNHGRF